MHPPKTQVFDPSARLQIDTKGVERPAHELRVHDWGLYLSRPVVARPNAWWIETWVLPELGVCLSDWYWRPGHERDQDLYVDVAEIVHVGDKLPEDVHSPLLAGARALWVHPDHTRAPRIAGPDRYRTAPDLAEAIRVLHEWIPASQPRPALPVRAAALIRDHHRRLLLVRGPDDEDFSLPGGRCDKLGPDAPPTAMAREVSE